MPSTYKTILTTISVIAVSITSHGVIMAQDDAVSYGSATTGVTASQMFTESDLNNDGGLDREEFVDYAIAQAKAGDVDFGALILSGDYDNEFNTHDDNADGILTVDEMKLPALSQDLDEDGSKKPVLNEKE